MFVCLFVCLFADSLTFRGVRGFCWLSLFDESFSSNPWMNFFFGLVQTNKSYFSSPFHLVTDRVAEALTEVSHNMQTIMNGISPHAADVSRLSAMLQELSAVVEVGEKKGNIYCCCCCCLLFVNRLVVVCLLLFVCLFVVVVVVVVYLFWSPLLFSTQPISSSSPLPGGNCRS